jgi:cation diffusion facilitator CzcD-associated flavoprotein CzcO
VKTNTEVVSAEWIDVEGIWKVQLKNCLDGSIFYDTCNVLHNGSGVLTKWKWPAITGLQDFKGELAHSAAWPEDLSWAGKRVGLIGTGSSSIQIAPRVAETASRLSVFMRNVTYISPQFGANVDNKEADPESMDPADAAAGKHFYTAKEKQRFLEDPDYLHDYRTRLEKSMVGGWDMFYRGSELNVMFKELVQKSMRERLQGREDLQSQLIPSWSPGCRRLTPGEGYLETLRKDNVDVIWGEIAQITEKGLITAAGHEVEVDVLICATGFSVQYLPHFKLTGLNGQVIQDQTDPNIYASIAHPGFPNYFVTNGPRGNWALGCALPSHDVQVEYMLQCCKKLQEDQIKSMHPKQRVTDQLNAYEDAWHAKHSIWAEDCKSWYKDNTKDGRVYVWPGSMLHHLKFMKRPRFEHYEMEYQDEDNIFRFLGGGKTIGQIKYGADAPVPYIREKEEQQWDIE